MNNPYKLFSPRESRSKAPVPQLNGAQDAGRETFRYVEDLEATWMAIQ
jgi:hypothetical protein